MAFPNSDFKRFGIQRCKSAAVRPSAEIGSGIESSLIFEFFVTPKLKAVLPIDFSPKMVKMLICENS
jgi:hypothetical protein